ncbi:hypothetical protein IAQ61_011835 [Plenodomus lingam]|uniref:uncharacterized protein n=1 Tax=Leptosphaeria maculans TaxID=5022 RepID=UPI0033292BBA|nr:hypothetical protein IAQ61_011835 [Plenodomus lingam]
MTRGRYGYGSTSVICLALPSVSFRRQPSAASVGLGLFARLDPLEEPCFIPAPRRDFRNGPPHTHYEGSSLRAAQ